MDGQYRLDGLQLEHDLLFYNKVDSIAAIKLHIFVYDRQVDLLSKSEVVQFQFST